MFLLGGPAVCHANVFRSVCTSSHAHRVTSCWLGLHYRPRKPGETCLSLHIKTINRSTYWPVCYTTPSLLSFIPALLGKFVRIQFLLFLNNKVKEIFKFICSKEDSESEQVSVCVLFFNLFKNERGAVYLYINSGVNYESFFAYRDTLYLFY